MNSMSMNRRISTVARALSRSLHAYPGTPCRTCLCELMRRLNIRSQPEIGTTTAFAAFPFPPAIMSSTLQHGVLLHRPDFGVNACQFPPLPTIQREDIRLRVFTHRSYYARSAHVFEDRPDDPSPDNEKFEHLGDSVLGFVVTSLVSDMYPNLRVGPSTKVRAKIVGNSTLAEISVRYKLPEQLRLHPAQAVTLCASTNVQADVFESFIGGLFTDQGIEACHAWLRPLFGPYARVAYDAVRMEHGLLPVSVGTSAVSPAHNGTGLQPTSPAPSSHSSGAGDGSITTGHLALFNQRLQKGDARVEWVYSDQHPFGESNELHPGAAAENGNDNAPDRFARAHGNKSTPVWSVQVLVDGEVYGRGRGNTKKAARNEAAKQGLVRMGVAVW
ncbi:Phosphoadenosine phosphosulfate reductase [Mycena venus]|uniref:Phosphoadenosine phosphosulfate reductase n=1 Tax=Mycena venus TaxID=2733690 RepID=A0A8H6Y5L2_9AGAR|nr:Phosphoadenosine phosphosulfate reductase [Mycena venus]